MAKPVVPISSSPIWPRISAKNIHKVAKTSNGTVEKVRDKVCDLPGRSPSHEPGSTGSEKPIETHNCIVRKPGISNQLGKVSDGRSPETGISGFSDRLSQYEVVHAQRKNERSTTAVPKTVKIRVDNSSETSKIIGKMTAAIRAILPAPLQFRHLQRLKTKALHLSNQSYESLIKLDPQCKTELMWWAESIELWNGKSMIKPSPDLAVRITTDASLKGWGAHCGKILTQGLWTEEEKKLHINALEMLAVNFAVKAFTKDKSNVQVHILVDNTTTVAYINKMGGTRSVDLIKITKQLWEYCLSKQITITAEHLPGSINQIADAQSRDYQDSSNSKLSPQVFTQIQELMGKMEIDLFADRMNKQLMKFVSWKPDPEAWETDAFRIAWSQMKAYAFPPFCLIGRCLSKVVQDEATLVLIAPTWQTQPWYSVLLEMIIEDPILLPPVPDLLTSPLNQIHPLQSQGLTLAAWKVSGTTALQRAYQKRLEPLSERQGAKALSVLTRGPGESGVAGVIKNCLIRFRPLWSV